MYAIPSWVLVIAGFSSVVMSYNLASKAFYLFKKLIDGWDQTIAIGKVILLVISLLLLIMGGACILAGIICIVVEGRYVLPTS